MQKQSVRGVRQKKVLEILQNSLKNTSARASFLIKLQAEACNFMKKETVAQGFYCQFCEISKNTFSQRTPLVAASVHNYFQRTPLLFRAYNHFSVVALGKN